MSKACVTRFAPSPTGYLHLGHAHSALAGYRAAAESGGLFLLRIEDIDQARARLEFEAAIFEDLAWLGLNWEKPVRRQSEHFADYGRALERLRQAGLLYPCFCTRQDIQAEISRSPSAPHGPDGPIYPGTCRNLPPAERSRRIADGAGHALRLDTARALASAGAGLTFHEATIGLVAADPTQFGDLVLARKDFPASYHLAVTVDDALQGVTLVTRGVDLLPATHVHRLLQALLDLPTPAYCHHKLLTDAEGKRLAKRDRASTLRDLRQSGRAPAEVRAMAGFPDAD